MRFFGRRASYRANRFRAEIDILTDLRRWRRTDSTRICQALYDLPARQPDRKETGQ